MRMHGRKWRMVIGTIAIVAALLAASTFVASRSQRRFLYPAPRDEGAFSPNAALRTFTAKDGLTVHALHFRAERLAQRTLVHFHGNGETVRSMMGIASDLQARGLDVLLVEYRGYGVSAGSPTEQGLYLDAEAALDGLAHDGVTRDRIVLWGTSLGSGVATEMAIRARGNALILVAPFTSIPNVVRDHVPLLPMQLLVTDRFDNLAKAPGVNVPTLIVHGTADTTVPYAMGRALADAIHGAELMTVEGGRHGDVYSRASSALFARIAAFGG